MSSALLIYNPAAGRFPAGPLLDRAVRVLTEAGWDVAVVKSSVGRPPHVIAQEAVEASLEAVFVAGGDGSVGTVAAVLAGSATILGVLPAGTANVWAAELGMRRLDWTHWFALENAAELLAKGTVRLVDVGECNDRAFLLWAGVGLDAKLVDSIEPRDRFEKAFGILRYAALGVWEALGWSGIDIRVTSGERVWQDRFVVAVASNIRTYAGGVLELSPDAKVDDGLLDFWLISGRRLLDVVMRLSYVLTRTHLDAPGIVHFQAREATFEASEAPVLQMDGEPVHLDWPLRFKVRERRLRVLVPATGAADLFSAESAQGAGGR
ncbi:MAG: diacylglycerol kinase family lipid kinase [Anaerolineales bacterium]|nr:diacylglycerol kinase family lipid kinase [Anaerolineales bacterium]